MENFKLVSRDNLIENSVYAMTKYKVHYQSLGTWSNNSSLTFCLMESLCSRLNSKHISQKFNDWFTNGYWILRGKVFDIGSINRKAI